MTLHQQLVLPDGQTTHALTEHLMRPASEVLAAGEATRVPEFLPFEILSYAEMTDVEAAAIAMDALGAQPGGGASLTDRMRIRHHAIARLIAAGYKKVQIAETIGVATATLSTLERSPAFQALVLEYMNMMDKATIESYTRLKIAGNLGIDELTRRLAEKPENIKTNEVIEIVKMSADRTGLGPTSKQVTLNGRLSPNELRALKTIEGRVEEEDTYETGISGVAPVLPTVGGSDFAFVAAERGEEVRENPAALAPSQDEIEGLITDLGEIFR